MYNKVLFAVIAVLIVFSIYTLIRYANTPMSEIPFWVYWLLRE